jgi:UMF1 family MFS transporter
MTAQSPATQAVSSRVTSRRELFGYCMFDFANSSYTTLIVTVAYSAYFRQAVVGVESGRGDLLWSVTQAVAYAILILISPVLGALADGSGRKKAFLMATSAVTIVACGLLYFVRPGDVAAGVLIYVVGTLGFESGYIFYNAFLPEVSTPKTIGRISGLSWGTGFIGGLVALVACMPFLARPLTDAQGVLDAQSVQGYRSSFVVIAAFFGLFAIPTFLFLRESPAGPQLENHHGYVRTGFVRVGRTLTHLREYRDTGKYVLASMCYYGGIEAVIKFAAIYAVVTFGIQGTDLILLFIFSNIIAVPGTVAAGFLADRIGGKRALALTLVLWIALVIWGALAQTVGMFWVMAAGVSIGMGSTQAIGRSLMSQLSPPGRESEFFGFYIMAGKFGAIVAFLLFGLISSGTGNQRLAVLWLLPLFVIGLGLLLSVKMDARLAVTDGPK